MATYTYTHKAWGHVVGIWYAEVTESNIDHTNNTSIVNIRFYVKAAHNNQRSDTYNNYPAGYGSSTPYAKIYIDGTEVKSKTPACFDLRYNSSKKIKNGTIYELGSVSKKINHNADGSKSVKISCYHYTSVSPKTVYCNGTFTLSKTVKPTTYSTSLSIQDGTHNLGNNVNMTVNGWDSKGNGLRHKIWFQLENNANYKVTTGWLNNGTHAINLPASWKQELLATHTSKIYVHLESYSGNNLVAKDDSKTMTIKNPDKGASLNLHSGTHNINSKFNFKQFFPKVNLL